MLLSTNLSCRSNIIFANTSIRNSILRSDEILHSNRYILLILSAVTTILEALNDVVRVSIEVERKGVALDAGEVNHAMDYGAVTRYSDISFILPRRKTMAS